MKRNHAPKVQSLDAAIQNVALLADNTWLFDDCFNDGFKQKNLELWVDFKEAEELAKSNQSTFTTQSRLADCKNFNYTSCEQNQEYPYKINQISNNSDENVTDSTYTCQHFSENVDRLYEHLTQPVSERLHSKMKFAQPMPPPLPAPTLKPETECNHCASSKRWLNALPWPSLLIKNFPALPEIIPDKNSLYLKEKPKNKRNELDLRKYPPPHYTIKSSEEFKLHMAITSRRVKEIWDDFPPSTGKTLEDIFESHSPGTSVELDCEIPEFYPRSWQVLPNSCKPISYDDQERTSQNTEYLTGCRSQVPVAQPQVVQPEGLAIQAMETKYSFGIVNQQTRIEHNNFIKMVEYSGWPVIETRALDEMNASVARLHPEREELFYEMITVVDTVYNFFEDGFTSQNNNNMNDTNLACYPVIHSEQSRDEENKFDQLEKEALEQYQGSDHQLMTVQNSDESIDKKFQDLEQEAMEQYNTSETLQEEEEEEKFVEELKPEAETFSTQKTEV